MVKKSMLSFIRDQYTKVPPVAQADLKGKTVIITGANTGLGLEAAQHFARMGAGKLILACRSKEKGQAAVERLKNATGYRQAELWLVDLADFVTVKAFAGRASQELGRIDVLVLNAGVGTSEYEATKDGWELSIQVNDLSGSLLAFLLLPRMQETAKKFNTTPRLVVVASEVHYWTSIEDKVFESPNAFQLVGSKEFSTPKLMKVRYLDSKLLNIFFTRAFNNHLKSREIIITAVNPGFCYSELRRNTRSLFMTIFEKLLARSAEEGSRQLVWAAVGVPSKGNEDELRGAYVTLAHVDEPADFVLGVEGEKKEDKLWVDLIVTLEAVDPRVRDIVSQHFT
ncbi:WW domain-containing oxidoreductase [Leucoagaricus sp. SymC.cos]|nr:WW domain-containing oxidoreductase [Leucoagaricus sp. SymC.cos]